MNTDLDHHPTDEQLNAAMRRKEEQRRAAERPGYRPRTRNYKAELMARLYPPTVKS